MAKFARPMPAMLAAHLLASVPPVVSWRGETRASPTRGTSASDPLGAKASANLRVLHAST